MSGVITEDFGTSDRALVTDGSSANDQRCQSADSIAEWRSSEQVENGTPSTSPLYWDTEDDDDCGPKPSDLYGRFTWKIESFSTISRRELRSNAFEVGGYKWYILIYPQGCDVCNHLSLFLCVANHDKLLPGWSHFAQFTIAVVNKDPKKSKYSDTLHRFWKKEHDWGWKKFMELSKVYDGFIVADTLVIKAQVQVIREKAHRPFRCLDCQYRRELVRVYLSNVEQISRRFIEERRDKLKKLIEDKLRWSSFRAFWSGSSGEDRGSMSRGKSDAILKIVVKHFFIEKEVTSTLVMDSLYSGLKALEYQSRNKKGRAKLIHLEELPAPMIRVDNDTFVLADDVLILLERAASEPLPHQSSPPKDDKSSQNRTKEGSSGEEFNRDSTERDERRLMELGRRTIEIFVLAHIFSKIEVSYQEVVALKRQEELIREEEAAGQAENDIKTKHGVNEKEKRSKKKQAKQKRNGRKGKDKVRDERSDAAPERLEMESQSFDKNLDEFCPEKVLPVSVKIDVLEDASDESNNGDDVVEAVRPDLDDRETSLINWETDTSEIHLATEASGSDVQNGQIDKSGQSLMDDSSSTCSTDSVPSVVITRTVKASAMPKNNNPSSTNRVKNKRIKETHDKTSSNRNAISYPSNASTDAGPSPNAGSKSTPPGSEAIGLTLKIQQLQKNLVEKAEEVVSLQKKSAKDPVDAERPSRTPSRELSSSSSSSPGRKPPVVSQQQKQFTEPATVASAVISTMTDPASSKEPSSNITARTDKNIPLPVTVQASSALRSEAQKMATPARIATVNQGIPVSRPPSAPIVPTLRPTTPVVSTVQAAPLLSRSFSASGRLDADPSSSAPSYVPQSYRNAIMGKTIAGTNAGGAGNQAASSTQGILHSQSPTSYHSSASVLPHRISLSTDQMPGFTFGSVKPDSIQNQRLRREESLNEAAGSSGMYVSDLAGDMQRLNIHGELRKKQYSDDLASRLTPSQAQGLMTEEFPHIDIINDLLDEEQSSGRTSNSFHHSFSRMSSFPGRASALDTSSIIGLSRFDQPEQYYADGFQRGYGSSSTLHGLRSASYPQVDLSPYANGHIDGLMPNGWLYGHADQSMHHSSSNRDANGYSYPPPDYSSYASGVNGYMYRHANGP